jgi:hypothetical protein
MRRRSFSTISVFLPAVPALALVLRLAGYGRSWLPSPVSLVLLVALAHILVRAADTKGDAAVAFFRRYAFAAGLAAAVALALIVRLPGVAADVGHTPLDIDENRLAASVKHFFDTGTIDHRTVEHYPGIVFWLFAAASFVRFVRDLTNGIELPPDQFPVASYVVAARTTNVILGAAIVALTGLTGKRMAGPLAGLLSAALVAIIPLSVDTTTVVRNDPGMLAIVLGAVYAAIVFHDTRRFGPLLTASVLAGLATAIKYSSMFAIAPVLIATTTGGPPRERVRQSAIALLAFVGAIAISNHFIWWDFPNFLRQLTAQVALTASGHWAATTNPAAFYVMVLARFGPGVVLGLLAGAFAVYALATRDKTRWIFVSFPLLYLWFMTQRPAQFPRWVFPLVPFVTIAGVVALRGLLSLIANVAAARPRPVLRAAFAAALVVAVGQPAWSGIVGFSRRMRPPTHVLAEQWLESHAPPGSVVASDLHFLDFRQSKLTVRRLDFETMMPAGAIEQLSGADWLVVPEPYFGNPMLRRLGFVQRFHADRGFGGHMGYDFEIYAVPTIPAPPPR